MPKPKLILIMHMPRTAGPAAPDIPRRPLVLRFLSLAAEMSKPNGSFLLIRGTFATRRRQFRLSAGT